MTRCIIIQVDCHSAIGLLECHSHLSSTALTNMSNKPETSLLNPSARLKAYMFMFKFETRRSIYSNEHNNECFIKIFQL